MSKFLVVERLNAHMPMGPPDSPEAAWGMKTIQSGMEYVIDLQKKGKIIAGGPFLDILGSCGIYEVDSVEELGEIFFNNPLNLWMTREVHPLGTTEDSLEGMKEAAEAMK